MPYRPPPQPVAHPSEEWADAYAKWYHQRAPEYRIGNLVKRLEWEYPGSHNNLCWTAKTILGTYSVANEDGWYACLEDGMSWEWESPEDPRSYQNESAAQMACQEHFIREISKALAA